MVVRAVARSGVRKKGVAGQQHQVEALVQPGRSGVIEHPGYARAPAAAFRQGEHRRGRIDADDETIRFPGQRRRQHAGAAAKIDYCAAPLRQITAKVEILGPAILNVVRSKDRRNGRTRSFRRSHAHWCWLAPRAGTPHQAIMGGNIGRNPASHFPGGRAAKWATYKSSKMTARRSHPALSSQP
jgi:hypothetical protein